ncbi:pumilio homolog 23-like [Olea europaea var. sylvestris]|uniref:pumilio homolog 23-like n=1 Tax=Olea europaea var. sylvestris TaxID=158386 RepID=UPI000C1CEE15|nr:pumilio homolog 23-like [Olea europaea var. sylvestris]
MWSVLYLCEGETLGLSEFHSSKPSVLLAERLNLRSSPLDGHKLQHYQKFPDQLKFLVSEMLNPSRVDIATFVVNQYSSLVLQFILEVAPDTLYDELLTKVFRDSLFKMSSHHTGNFVVQSLVSHARSHDHICAVNFSVCRIPRCYRFL